MEVPQQLVKDLTSHMESAGIPVPDSEERWAMALDALKVLHRSSASPLLHTSLVHSSSFVLGFVWDAQTQSFLHTVLPAMGAGCSNSCLLASISLVADHVVNHTQGPCHADRSWSVSSLVSSFMLCHNVRIELRCLLPWSYAGCSHKLCMIDLLHMQGVWASKYNERAFLSMKKVGLNFLDLRMAVLVQRVVPAAYAFVIHTENPTNGAKDEIFAELVKGLGESIVSGMVPGSSLSFYAKKGSLDKPEVCFDGQTVCGAHLASVHYIVNCCQAA